jgi:hypothetical protein
MALWRRMALAALIVGGSGLGAIAQIERGPIPPETISGKWKAPNGTCQPAYYTGGEQGKSPRNEKAFSGTVTDKGMTVTGQIILQGARQGQMVNPQTDKAIFLIDVLKGPKIKFIPIGEPVLSWPEIDTEKCP